MFTFFVTSYVLKPCKKYNSLFNKTVLTIGNKRRNTKRISRSKMVVFTKVALVISSTSVVGYVALRHLRNIVKETKIPQSSILYQYFQDSRQAYPDQRHYADAFKAELPSRLRTSSDDDNQKYKFDVDSYVKIFYSSAMFKAEKAIMKLLCNQPEPDLTRFDVGKSVYLWKVHSRNEHEILLTWQVRSVKGSTWFCVQENENIIMFGSSIQTPNLSYNADKPDSAFEEANSSIAITSSNVNPKATDINERKNKKTFKEKMIAVIDTLAQPIVLTFHKTYSIILVNGVLKNLKNNLRNDNT